MSEISEMVEAMVAVVATAADGKAGWRSLDHSGGLTYWRELMTGALAAALVKRSEMRGGVIFDRDKLKGDDVDSHADLIWALHETITRQELYISKIEKEQR